MVNDERQSRDGRREPGQTAACRAGPRPHSNAWPILLPRPEAGPKPFRPKRRCDCEPFAREGKMTTPFRVGVVLTPDGGGRLRAVRVGLVLVQIAACAAPVAHAAGVPVRDLPPFPDVASE